MAPCVWNGRRRRTGLLWVLCCSFPFLADGQSSAKVSIDALMDSCRAAEKAGDHDRALQFLATARGQAEAQADSTALASLLIDRSDLLIAKGDLDQALIDLYAAQRIHELRGDETGLANVYNQIGGVHFYDKDFAKAGAFYAKSLAIRERIGPPTWRAILYGNIGSVLDEMGRSDSALAYHRRNLDIRLAEGERSWIIVGYGNLGSCFDLLGRNDSARHYLQRAMDLLGSDAPPKLKGSTSMMLGAALLRGGDVAGSIKRCSEALAIAEQLGSLPMKEECYNCLCKAYDQAGRHAEAFAMLQRYVAARDSLSGQERAKDLLRIELTYLFRQKQLADSLAGIEDQHRSEFAFQQRLAAERDQKRFYLLGGIGVLLLAGGLWNRLRFVRRSRTVIQRERDRSNELLLNILPADVAQELKMKGHADAKRFEDVSILFTDFKDFTQVSARMSPEELVRELNACFKAFDTILARYGVEKIKTIGDAYMAAGGVPNPSPDSALRTVQAALEMQAFMRSHAALREADGRPAFTMRAGVHTGPVVAGVVGDRKFQYDVWGDTVNTASRMETTGEPGQVNISADTYARICGANDLRFIPRGQLDVKGKGSLNMYFVEPAVPSAPDAS